MKKKQGSYNRVCEAIRYLHENDLMSRYEVFIRDRDIYEFKGVKEVHNSFLNRIIKIHPIISEEYLYEGTGKLDSGLIYNKRLSIALKDIDIPRSDSYVVNKILKYKRQLRPGPTMNRICNDYNININFILKGELPIKLTSSRFHNIISEVKSIHDELKDAGLNVTGMNMVTGEMPYLEGINRLPKRMKDGSIEIYYYDKSGNIIFIKKFKNGKFITKF